MALAVMAGTQVIVGCSGKVTKVLECGGGCSSSCKFEINLVATADKTVCGGRGGYKSAELRLWKNSPARPCVSDIERTGAGDHLTWTTCDGNTPCKMEDKHFPPNSSRPYDPRDPARPWVGQTTSTGVARQPLHPSCYDTFKIKPRPSGGGSFEFDDVKLIAASFSIDLMCQCQREVDGNTTTEPFSLNKKFD